MSSKNTKVKAGIRKLSAAENEMVDGKRLYTVKEAALYLGRSVHAVRELIWSRFLPVVQHGRKMWIDLADLNRYIYKHKALV